MITVALVAVYMSACGLGSEKCIKSAVFKELHDMPTCIKYAAAYETLNPDRSFECVALPPEKSTEKPNS